MNQNEIVQAFLNRRDCPRCSYTWVARVSDSKRCPRCQAWLLSAKSDEDKAQETKK